MNDNEQIPNELPETDSPRDALRQARRDFNLLGIAFFAMMAIEFLLSNGLSYLGKKYFPDFAATEWFYWLVGSGTIYLAAMPAAALILRAVPRRHVLPEVGGAKAKPAHLGGFEIFLAVLMCLTLMQAGNMVGNFVNNLFAMFTGRFSQSGLDSITMNTTPAVMFAIVVVIGPLMEELVFRKLIIDRISRYGAMTATVISALIFGLCHGNLQQFFYAFALGMFLGFIYLRTGNIRVTALLHMLVNLIGGFIPSMLLRRMYSSEGFSELMKMYGDIPLTGESQMTPAQLVEMLKLLSDMILPILLILCWSFTIFGLACVGIYLFVADRKKLTLTPCRPAETVIPKSHRGEVIFLNVGMILYIAVMAVLIALSFFM